MSGDVDVVIVGAGPAGLAAAASIAGHGLRVQVFDRKRLPIDKVCGEGLMPPGLLFLEQMGAKRHLHPDDSFPFSGIRYHSPGGETAASDFAEGNGLGIRRTALSRALGRAVSELPNVSISEGKAVKSVGRRADMMEVQLEGGPTVASRLVVGADGLRSRVREWAGLAGKPSPAKRLGIRRHFALRPWSRFVEVHAGRGLEAYVTPSGPRRVGIAILWERGQIDGTAPGAGLFDSLLARLPELHARLRDAPPDSEPLSTGPLAQNVRARCSDGVALIGDAAGYVDACTGEGLTLAFKQAGALAECLASAAENSRAGLISSKSLADYDRACRRIARPYTFGTRMILRLYRRPRLLERAIKLLGSRPALLQHLLSFNMGTGPLRPGLRQALAFIKPSPDRDARPA